MFCTHCGLANGDAALVCRGCDGELVPVPERWTATDSGHLRASAATENPSGRGRVVAGVVLGLLAVSALAASLSEPNSQRVIAAAHADVILDSTATTASSKHTGAVHELTEDAAQVVPSTGPSDTTSSSPVSPAKSVGPTTTVTTAPGAPVPVTTTTTTRPTTTPAPPTTVTTGPACPSGKPSVAMASFSVPYQDSGWYYPAIKFVIDNATSGQAWVQRIDFDIFLADGTRAASFASLEQTYVAPGDRLEVSIDTYLQATSQPTGAKVTGLLFQWEYPHAQCPTGALT